MSRWRQEKQVSMGQRAPARPSQSAPARPCQSVLARPSRGHEDRVPLWPICCQGRVTARCAACIHVLSSSCPYMVHCLHDGVLPTCTRAAMVSVTVKAMVAVCAAAGVCTKQHNPDNIGDSESE